MKKWLALMLMALMVFTVGCLTSDSGDDEGDNGGDNGGSTGSSKAAEYIPLKVGATWTMKQTDQDGYVNYSKNTIPRTATVDGKEYYVLSEDGDETYIRLANNIAYVYLEDMFFAKAQAIKATLEYKELAMYDFNKSEGKTWTILSESGSEMGSTYTVKMTGKYVGIKSVTTPAAPSRTARCSR